MAWNRNSGGGGGPWGSGGGPRPPGGGGGGRGPGPGGGGDQPPDLDVLLRQGQDKLRSAFPSGAGGGAMFLLFLVIIAVLWGFSGVYRVGSDEVGVVMRFGKALDTYSPPGLHWHVPWPVETVRTPQVTRVFREDVPFAGNGESLQTSRRSGAEDQLMLTRDRNFLNVQFSVFYRINDAKSYLFNVEDQSQTVRAVGQAAMREVVGRGEFDALQTEQRGAAEIEARNLIQQTLDSYTVGIEIVEVRLQRVDPPDRALEAARDVESARQERETLRNQAEAYQNRIIPEARGQAERISQEAQAYKQRVIAEADGDTQRFNSIYTQYKRAPEVTRRRMYLETMERVMGGMEKVIIDQKAGGVVPYLPLPELKKNKGAN